MIPILALAIVGPTQKLASCCPSMVSFAADPAFVATHLRPLPLKFQSSEGKQVSFSGPDGSHSGYYVPGTKGTSSAIVMVHEWWGLNDYIKREAVRVHNATGYGVLAVDLYQGVVAQTPEEAGKLMAAVKPEEASATVSDAVQDLYKGDLGRPYHRIGSIGWCFGGGWSLQTAILGGSKVKACVMFYGMPDDSQIALAKLKAPVLLMEALQDKWISPKIVGKFRVAMGEAHKSLHVVTYQADHAFANPSNPKYKKAYADDAMKRSLTFFRRYLG